MPPRGVNPRVPRKNVVSKPVLPPIFGSSSSDVPQSERPAAKAPAASSMLSGPSSARTAEEERAAAAEAAVRKASSVAFLNEIARERTARRISDKLEPLAPSPRVDASPDTTIDESAPAQPLPPPPPVPEVKFEEPAADGDSDEGDDAAPLSPTTLAAEKHVTMRDRTLRRGKTQATFWRASKLNLAAMHDMRPKLHPPADHPVLGNPVGIDPRDGKSARRRLAKGGSIASVASAANKSTDEIQEELSMNWLPPWMRRGGSSSSSSAGNGSSSSSSAGGGRQVGADFRFMGESKGPYSDDPLSSADAREGRQLATPVSSAYNNDPRCLLTAQQEAEVRAAFHTLDTDWDGFIRGAAVEKALVLMGMHPTGPNAKQKSRALVDDLLRHSVRATRKSLLNYERFCRVMARRIWEYDAEQEVQYGLENLFVDDKTGAVAPSLTCYELRVQLMNKGRIRLQPGELDEIIKLADPTGTGRVTLEQLKGMPCWERQGAALTQRL